MEYGEAKGSIEKTLFDDGLDNAVWKYIKRFDKRVLECHKMSNFAEGLGKPSPFFTH
jgi:hypothetical protein